MGYRSYRFVFEDTEDLKKVKEELWLYGALRWESVQNGKLVRILGGICQDINPNKCPSDCSYSSVAISMEDFKKLGGMKKESTVNLYQSEPLSKLAWLSKMKSQQKKGFVALPYENTEICPESTRWGARIYKVWAPDDFMERLYRYNEGLGLMCAELPDRYKMTKLPQQWAPFRSPKDIESALAEPKPVCVNIPRFNKGKFKL